MNKFARLLMTVFASALLLCMGLAAAACGTNTYSVTVEFEASQGSVTLSPSSADGKYEQGAQITVTVTAADGYEIDAFTVNGKAETLSQSGTYSLTVGQDTAIKATFKEEIKEPEKYTVTVNSSQHGTVELDPQAPNNEYEADTQVKVKVTPAADCILDTFTVDGEDKKGELSENVYTLTVTKDVTIAADFKATYAVTVTQPQNGTIETDPQPTDGRYTEGTQLSVTVTPATNYILDTFTVDGEDKKGELSGNVYTFTVEKDVTVAATFKATYAVTVTQPQNGTIEIDPQPTDGRYTEGTQLSVTVTPAANYILDTFTVDGADKKGELSGNVYTFTVTKDVTVAATFKAVYTVTVTIEPSDKASYTLSPAEGPYEADSSVTFTLTPAEDYEPDAFTVNGEPAAWDGSDAFVKTLTVQGNIAINVIMKETPGLFPKELLGEWHVIDASGSNVTVSADTLLDLQKKGATVGGQTAAVTAADEGYTLTVGETAYTLKAICEGTLLSLTADGEEQYLYHGAELVSVALPAALQGDWVYGSESSPTVVNIKNDGTMTLPFLGGSSTGTVIYHSADAKKFVAVNAYFGTFTWLVATYEEGASVKFEYPSRSDIKTQECHPAPTGLKVTLKEEGATGGELTDFFVEPDFSFTKNDDGTYNFPVKSTVNFKVTAPAGYTVHEVKSDTVSYPYTITPNGLGYYEVTTVYKTVTITVTYWKESIFPSEYLGDWYRIGHGTLSADTSFYADNSKLTLTYRNGNDSVSFQGSSGSDLAGDAQNGYTFTTGYGSSKTTYKFQLVGQLMIVWAVKDDPTVQLVAIKKGDTLKGETLAEALGLYNTSWSSEGGSLITIAADGTIAADVTKEITTSNAQGTVTVLSNDPEKHGFTAFMDVNYGYYYTFAYDAAEKTLTITDYCGHAIVFKPTPATYEVTATVTPSEGATVALSAPVFKAGYKAGDEVTLTITLKVGYSVESVKIGNETLSAQEDGTYKFTVSGETAVVVTLGTYETVTVTYTRTGGSYPTVYLESADGSVYSGSGYTASPYVFKKGAEAVVRFSHSTSNRILSVILDDGTTQTTLQAGTGASASYDYYYFTADKNYTLTVTLVQTYQIDIQSVTNGTVTIEASSTVYQSGNYYYADKDSEIVILIQPADGYRLASIKVGSSAYNGTELAPRDGKYLYKITGKTVIVVTFEEIPAGSPAAAWQTEALPVKLDADGKFSS